MVLCRRNLERIGLGAVHVGCGTMLLLLAVGTLVSYPPNTPIYSLLYNRFILEKFKYMEGFLKKCTLETDILLIQFQQDFIWYGIMIQFVRYSL